MGNPAKLSSRTIELGKVGLGCLILLAFEVLVALGMGVSGDELKAGAEVIGSLALSVSVVATGSAMGHSARHWGAAEGSGGKGSGDA